MILGSRIHCRHIPDKPNPNSRRLAWREMGKYRVQSSPKLQGGFQFFHAHAQSGGGRIQWWGVVGGFWWGNVMVSILVSGSLKITNHLKSNTCEIFSLQKLPCWCGSKAALLKLWKGDYELAAIGRRESVICHNGCGGNMGFTDMGCDCVQRVRHFLHRPPENH